MHVCVCSYKTLGESEVKCRRFGHECNSVLFATSTAQCKERSKCSVKKKKETREKALHQAGLKNQRRHQTQNWSLVKALIARGITLAEMLLQAWCWFKTPVIMGQPGWRSVSLTPPVLSYNVTMHLNWKNHETLVLPYSSALNERGPSICHPCHETNCRATIVMPTDADYDITKIAVTPMGLVSQSVKQARERLLCPNTSIFSWVHHVNWP